MQAGQEKAKFGNGEKLQQVEGGRRDTAITFLMGGNKKGWGKNIYRERVHHKYISWVEQFGNIHGTPLKDMLI